jgi:hypothetical protein
MVTLISDLSAIATVQVGEGGGASAVYPVIEITRSSKREGAASVTPGAVTQRLRRMTVVLRCLAQAGSLATIGTLRATLESTLCQTGARIRIVEVGSTWDLPAYTGAAGGSQPGYPTASIADDPEHIAGLVHGFTLTCETLVLDTGAVEHDSETTERTDETSGDVTTTGSGTVIVTPNTTAKAWILANVIAPLQTAVGISGETLVFSITVSPQDTTRAKYTYTIAPADAVSPGGGITSARVIDETRETSGGETIRTISGDATGGSASTFAAGQEPTPGSGEVLISRTISEPQVSDGRVSFRYELLVGVADSYFGSGKHITRWTERVGSPTIGIREAGFHLFQGAPPSPFLGPQQGFEYTQESQVEWIGAQDDEVIPLVFSSANLVGSPQRTIEMIGPDRWRETLRAVFFFATAQSMPAIHELGGL